MPANWLMPIKELSRCSYVCESELSSVITQFKFDSAGLGDKQPRLGHVRKPVCPACPSGASNSGIHLLFECGAVSALRCETGISAFLTLCLHRGLTLSEIYSHFINGLDSHGKPILSKDYIERGKCMRDMRDAWLGKW